MPAFFLPFITKQKNQPSVAIAIYAVRCRGERENVPLLRIALSIYTMHSLVLFTQENDHVH